MAHACVLVHFAGHGCATRGWYRGSRGQALGGRRYIRGARRGRRVQLHARHWALAHSLGAATNNCSEETCMKHWGCRPPQGWASLLGDGTWGGLERAGSRTSAQPVSLARGGGVAHQKLPQGIPQPPVLTVQHSLDLTAWERAAQRKWLGGRVQGGWALLTRVAIPAAMPWLIRLQPCNQHANQTQGPDEDAWQTDSKSCPVAPTAPTPPGCDSSPSAGCLPCWPSAPERPAATQRARNDGVLFMVA